MCETRLGGGDLALLIRGCRRATAAPDQGRRARDHRGRHVAQDVISDLGQDFIAGFAKFSSSAVDGPGTSRVDLFLTHLGNMAETSRI
jgi:hypothetical protein